MDMTSDIEAHCRTRFGMETSIAGNLPELKHNFTHFSLRIAPRLLEVSRIQLGVAEPAGQRWLAPEDALHAAIPTPVRKLIQQLLETGSAK